MCILLFCGKAQKLNTACPFTFSNTGLLVLLGTHVLVFPFYEIRNLRVWCDSLKLDGGRTAFGLKSPQELVVLCHWETEHWSVKMAVRLVCAFDCSFLSKEDLTFKRDLILSFV